MKQHRSKKSAPSRAALAGVLLVFIACFATVTVKAWDDDEHDVITSANWGLVTAPVFGTSESGAYAGAELFAGPDKFGSYFSGVLPNGRIVKPAGTTIQIGMNPLGAALTPDGKFLVTSNDDEREGGLQSQQNPALLGSYSLTVVNTSSMKVVSQLVTGVKFFIGLQITGTGPYTIWASGGPDNDIKLYSMDVTGTINTTPVNKIKILPIHPNTAGYVNNYTSGLPATAPVPSSFSGAGAQITFPAGSALSPDGHYLYVACNGDNSVAVINTTTQTVINQIPVGFFPYTVTVSKTGDRIFVSNWGITDYKFANPTYTGSILSSLGTTGQNAPDGYYVPETDAAGANPKTSSVAVLKLQDGDPTKITVQGSVYQGHALDDLYHVGDTHPSASVTVHYGFFDVVYVAKTNADSLGAILLFGRDAGGPNMRGSDEGIPQVVKLPDIPLSPLQVGTSDGHKVTGTYPNALVVSPDRTKLYVAEAGLNSVAVLDIGNPLFPHVAGRIPTDWYPTALALSSDGRYLYVANAKGIGEDINQNTQAAPNVPPPTGLVSDIAFGVDSNFIFGTLQQIDLHSTHLDNTTVLRNNFAMHQHADTRVVPVGGEASDKIKHVIFILHENKTFDSMLGNQGTHFGDFASTTFNRIPGGAPYTSKQYTGVSLNMQTLGTNFATAVNYFSDSEESDAGHQFAASGTSSDYTQKTLLVKSGRGLLVNKNFEPEDYPASGYIFNNAARNGVSFKDYGALVRIEGTDTGSSKPTTLNDPNSGSLGYPKLQTDNLSVTQPLVNLGDVNTPVSGLGQSYFIKLPILAILGKNNESGEPHLDKNYPGYNFNISDQRRALEFIDDFDRMVASGTLPTYIYIYQPNDHTGGVQAPNAASVLTASNVQQVADGDVGLGMVIEHIMKSPIYYDSATDTGSTIFITFDDAQSTVDHIHPHRTPLLVVSPFAKPGYVGTRHYSTASIVKTEELLLGLPPNNFGDLFATDLRDFFQPDYNGITASSLTFTRDVAYVPSSEGKRIWALANKLDSSAPDRDSLRLGALGRVSMKADDLHFEAEKAKRLNSKSYKTAQTALYREALKIVNAPAPRDSDD